MRAAARAAGAKEVVSEAAARAAGVREVATVEAARAAGAKAAAWAAEMAVVAVLHLVDREAAQEARTHRDTVWH